MRYHAGIRRMFDRDPGFLAFFNQETETLPRFYEQRVLKELGYIRRDISADEIFDLSLIRKIHPGKDHYHDPLHPG